MSFGEIGKSGVPISTIEDMENLFKDIDLEKISLKKIDLNWFIPALVNNNDLSPIGRTGALATREWLLLSKKLINDSLICELFIDKIVSYESKQIIYSMDEK